MGFGNKGAAGATSNASSKHRQRVEQHRQCIEQHRQLPRNDPSKRLKEKRRSEIFNDSDEIKKKSPSNTAPAQKSAVDDSNGSGVLQNHKDLGGVNALKKNPSLVGNLVTLDECNEPSHSSSVHVPAAPLRRSLPPISLSIRMLPRTGRPRVSR